MTARRLFAVVFIFAATALAWFILGASVTERTRRSQTAGHQSVSALWGGKHAQTAPRVLHRRSREVSEEVTESDDSGRQLSKRLTKLETYTVPIELSSSSIKVDLDLEHRKKGLLWHDTYKVAFDAVYAVEIPGTEGESVRFLFPFPSGTAIYDDFTIEIDGREVAHEIGSLTEGAMVELAHRPGETVSIAVRYRSRGLDTWHYRFGEPSQNVGRINEFELAVATNFEDVDFPAGALSPTSKRPSERGWRLEWRFDNLLSGQHVGIDLPNRLNPGPLTARIIFFAPVSLLFFVTVLVMLGALRYLELHPMHFFFLSAAFFSFHLLMAYLVDHVNIHAAFVLAAIVSVALVASYLRLICGTRKALRYAASAQVVFLVLFSYAFFFEGLTGLAVTIGSIVTLFALMQLTARVDWNRVFEPVRSPSPLAEGSPRAH